MRALLLLFAIGSIPSRFRADLTPTSRTGKPDALKVLLDKSADANKTNSEGQTALMVAAGVGWSDGRSHGSQAEAPEALKLCLE
jgi:ankyrin repeat protein